MKKPCILKPKDNKLRLTDYKGTITMANRLPHINHNNVPCSPEKENYMNPKQQKRPQRAASQQKRRIRFTVGEESEESTKIVPRAIIPKVDKRNPILRIQKSYSTSKCLQSNKYFESPSADVAKSEKTTELRYLRKRKQLETYLLEKAIIVKDNERFFSLPLESMSKFINTLLYFTINQGSKGNTIDPFLKQNTLLVQLNDFVSSDTEFSHDKNQENTLHMLTQRIAEANKQEKRQRQIIEYLKQQIAELKKEQARVTSDMQKAKSILKSTTQQLSKMEDYADKQSSPILKVFGQEYMMMQQELKQYAIKLQSLKQLEDVSTEMLPFQTIQSTFVQKLKEINLIVKLDKTISPGQKLDMLRSYINKALQIIKDRDQQIRAKLCFKTKCIVQFVQMMKKWHLNWSFKNQYLQGLKKQFVVYYYQIDHKIDQCIDYLESKSEEQTRINPQLLNNLRNIQEKQLKLFKCYELGNIFY